MEPERSAGPPAAGYFGKLPDHGDFIHAGLSDRLLRGIDQVLSGGLVEAARQLDHWFVDVYREAPVWQFRFGARHRAWPGFAGLLGYSHDASERQFPFIVLWASRHGPAAALPDSLVAEFAELVKVGGDVDGHIAAIEALLTENAAAEQPPEPGVDELAVWMTAGNRGNPAVRLADPDALAPSQQASLIHGDLLDKLWQRVDHEARA